MYGEVQYSETQYGSVGGNYAAYTSTLDDTVTPTDTIRKATTRLFGLETVTLTETLFDWVYGKGLAFMDTLTGTEVFRRAYTTIKLETGTLTEVFAKAYNRFRSFTDNFSGLVDTFTYAIGRFLTFMETLNPVEIFMRSSGRSRSFSETGTLTEVFAFIKGFNGILTDSFGGLTDSITRAIGGKFYDITTISDSIRRYINGLLVNLWTKIVKPSAPTYTKELKPNVQDIWTVEEKPY